jgi:DNA (cytosine-5)-methyltransferase 1
VLDLFAGAGGFSLGFEWAGFSTSVAIDVNPNATETLVGNFAHKGTVVLEKDLRNYSATDLDMHLRRAGLSNQFDVIVGGPPCQGWSMVGRGKIRSLSEETGRACPETDPRNELYKRFLGFVRHFQPKVAVMENVAGMLSHAGKNIADQVAVTLSAAGYRVTWARINASDYGIPQSRDRLFFVGVRNDLNIKFAFPNAKRADGSRAYPPTTVRDAISDLPIIRHGAKEWIRPYTPPKKISEFAQKMRKGADPSSIFDHVCRTHNAQDLEAFNFMRQGGWYRDLPKRLQRYRDDIFEDKYKKLSWSKPSGCVTAHLSRDCYTHIHPSQARTISVREAARFQSFPDSFYLAGSMGSKFELVGNAVAPMVAEMIAKEVRRQVFNRLTSTKPTARKHRLRELSV